METPYAENTVYATLRTYDTVIFRLDDHVDRLLESARLIHLHHPFTFDDLKSECLAAVDSIHFDPVRLRIVLSDQELNVEVEPLSEKPDEYYRNGVAGIFYEGIRHDPDAKRHQQMVCANAKQAAVDSGAFEAVLVDENGMIGECAYANLFWVKNGQLYTVESGVLPGITRRTVLEIADDCQFDRISKEELLKADELFYYPNHQWHSAYGHLGFSKNWRWQARAGYERFDGTVWGLCG
ncbi:aminotransferase class IV family protein [Candidatus Peregrinibacteria bacterium]|nr:MAG: aminotransferase class IV family protein [Candidatus Peregrinibacteria bacterium]